MLEMDLTGMHLDEVIRQFMREYTEYRKSTIFADFASIMAIPSSYGIYPYVPDKSEWDYSYRKSVLSAVSVGKSGRSDTIGFLLVTRDLCNCDVSDEESHAGDLASNSTMCRNCLDQSGLDEKLIMGLKRIAEAYDWNNWNHS